MDSKDSSQAIPASRETSSRRSWKQNRSIPLIVILIVGLTLRIVFVAHLLRVAPLSDFWASGFEASNIAASLAGGRGYSSPFGVSSGPTAWATPAYSALVAVAYRTFGLYSLNAVRFLEAINILSTVATSVCLYLIGIRIFGARIAWGAALLWNVCPDSIFMTVRLWESNISVLFVVLLTLWYVRLIQDPAKDKDWIIYGLLCAVGSLTTASLLSLLTVPFLVLAVRRRFRGIGIVLTVIGVGMLPWTVRNYVQFGELVPLRSSFGAELWAGNHPGVSDPGDETKHPSKNRDELNAYLSLGEATYVRQRQTMAWTFIRENPHEFLRLVGRRFVSFWCSPRILVWWWPGVCAVLAWATAGFMVWKRSIEILAPFISALLIFPITYYLTHAESFFRYLIEPLVWLLAVAGIFCIVDWLGDVTSSRLSGA